LFVRLDNRKIAAANNNDDVFSNDGRSFGGLGGRYFGHFDRFSTRSDQDTNANESAASQERHTVDWSLYFTNRRHTENVQRRHPSSDFANHLEYIHLHSLLVLSRKISSSKRLGLEERLGWSYMWALFGNRINGRKFIKDAIAS
jgi:hypothetical protein